MLPNDVILIRNIGECHEGLRGRGGGDDDQQGHPTEIGGPVHIWMETGGQDQSALNCSPRTHPDSIFGDPHMDGQLI